MENKMYTFDTRKQKKVLIGTIDGETLTKLVIPSKHFMRRVDGYGIQYQAVNELVIKGVTKIVIEEKDGNTWTSGLNDWLQHGSVADFGSGKQYFLSLRYMKKRGAKFEPLVKPKPISPQTKLFEL